VAEPQTAEPVSAGGMLLRDNQFLVISPSLSLFPYLYLVAVSVIYV